VYRKYRQKRIKARKKFVINDEGSDVRNYKSYKAKKEFESVVLKETNKSKQKSKSSLEMLLMTVKWSNQK
jgi:hypothetical protein